MRYIKETASLHLHKINWIQWKRSTGWRMKLITFVLPFCSFGFYYLIFPTANATRSFRFVYWIDNKRTTIKIETKYSIDIYTFFLNARSGNSSGQHRSRCYYDPWIISLRADELYRLYGYYFYTITTHSESHMMSFSMFCWVFPSNGLTNRINNNNSRGAKNKSLCLHVHFVHTHKLLFYQFNRSHARLRIRTTIQKRSLCIWSSFPK